MANRIKAIGAYQPRIVLGKRAGMDEMVDFISRSTGLNESTIRQVLLELRDGVVFFNLRGEPVQLEGLGTYTPTLELDGTIGVGHRADMEIKQRLNAPGDFKGEVENRQYIGKTGSELVALWNKEHPDDPVK